MRRLWSLVGSAVSWLLRGWLLVRLWLPWEWLLRLTLPSEALLLDWRQVHGWGRREAPRHRPVRSYWERYAPDPQHLCRDDLPPDGFGERRECPCFDDLRSGDVVMREPVVSHTGG